MRTRKRKTRSRYGDGTAFQRANGKWVAQLSLGPDHGGKRMWFSGKTAEEVNRKMQDYKHDLRYGLVAVADGPMPRLGTWLGEWITSRKPNLAPKTHRSYASYIEQHIVPALGNVKLDALKAPELQAFFDAKLRKLSAQSVLHMRTILSQSLGRAERQGLIPRNPVTLTDAPSLIRVHTPTFLSDEDLGRFLDAIDGDPLHAVYVLALATGLRQAELLGLLWEDIDLERGELQVRLQLQRVEGKLTRAKTKTSASRRSAALPAEAVAALRAHRVRQEEILGAAVSRTAFVFTTANGTPLDARNLVRSFKAVLKRAKLPKAIRFHDLRHSYASYLVRLGVHPRVVMESMGHSQISLTMNTYSHVMSDQQREAAGKLDGLLR